MVGRGGVRNICNMSSFEQEKKFHPGVLLILCARCHRITGNIT